MAAAWWWGRRLGGSSTFALLTMGNSIRIFDYVLLVK
jgi:hypothetical protein